MEQQQEERPVPKPYKHDIMTCDKPICIETAKLIAEREQQRQKPRRQERIR